MASALGIVKGHRGGMEGVELFKKHVDAIRAIRPDARVILSSGYHRKIRRAPGRWTFAGRLELVTKYIGTTRMDACRPSSLAEPGN